MKNGIKTLAMWLIIGVIFIVLLSSIMTNTNTKLKYSDLVGTAFNPRSSARCNGIVQATVKGQQRPFISDWPADNFVRWAQCLGL